MTKWRISRAPTNKNAILKKEEYGRYDASKKKGRV